MGKMATSPLPYRGSPLLQSGGQNQKWPTSGQGGYLPPAVSGIPPLQSGGQNQKSPTRGKIGYLTPAVSGIPAASEQGAKSEVAHKGENSLPHRCRIRGSPPLQSGGQNQKWPTSGQNGYLTPAVSGIPAASERGAKSEVAHKRENWLPHPCRIGDPRRFRAGGKVRSGPQMGKMATSPLPYPGIPAASERGAKSEVAHKWARWLPPPCRIGDPHRFRAGGKIRSGPQEGQIGYLTPAVLGIPAASERGAKSEVAHKGEDWLPRSCRIGDPHCLRAGGKIRSGPQVGELATSPLPYRGSPPLQSGGQNQKSPTSGQIGYLTPAVSGIPAASERGAKSEVAHKRENWLPPPCRVGDPRRFRAGGKIRSRPQEGKLATSPLPYWGSPPLQSGGQNQKWPTKGKIGYLGPAVSGIPTALERGAKSEVAHKWANWLPHPCRIRGSPPLQSGGQNQKWPTSGQNGYLTPAVSGIPAASERGAKSEVAHKRENWLPHPCRLGDPRRFRAGGKVRSGPQMGKMATSPLPYRGIPTASERGAKSEVAHKWARWLPPPCRIGDPHRFRAGGKIRSRPQEGQIGYLTPAVSGIPAASERGAKSEVAHKGEDWLPHPCRIGDPHCLRAGGKIRSSPQVGKLATSPLPYRGSPPLQSGGQNQKSPTSGQIGYLTPAVSGIPAASERGAKSEVAHKRENWLPPPCRIGDPRRFRAGGKIRSRPQEGKLATSPLPYRGSPPLQSGGQNQKWPTNGQNGYLTPARSGIPTASERGAKSEVAHKWARWLPPPCRIGVPRCFRAGGKIRSRPQERIGYLTPAVSGIPAASERGAKSEVAHKGENWLPHHCRIRGFPPLQSGGQNQKWPTTGQGGYLTPAVSGIPTASERGAKSEVAHKRENWLPHPCRLGDPRRFRAGGKIRSGPQMGKMATSPLPYRGIPAASEQGAKSEVAHKWARWLPPPLPYRGSPMLQSGGQNQKSPKRGANWLPHPCRIGNPRRFRAGGKIRSRPQRGKLVTSPLPYRGSLPLQSGGQNQKWPTSGQNGYLPPAVSGISTASERGAKSEVAHKRENWLPHRCRLGDPRRFRAGGKIRRGPQVGKMATSPLPYRGIPAASERGAKSEVAHKWARWLPHPCRIGDPCRFKARGKIRSGPQMGKMATSPLPYRGSPPLQSGGENQKPPTRGKIGYLTPAVSGIPAASERGAKSEVAHKRENWLPHPCRLGDPRRFRAGGKIRSGPQMGKMATSPLPYRGIPAASEQGAKSEVAHKWARWLPPPLPYRGSPMLQSGGQNQKSPKRGANWLPHPCRIGNPRRFRAGGKIRSRPQRGKLVTSPLPYRGSLPLQSGGQNQKWPTSGQNGYLPPAVSGISTASERGAKSEVAHKRENWLPHRCRLGDPRRFRAGGKIRRGPQVGKMATSPLPYRIGGSPLLQSGGQNQKWPTSGQGG